MGYGGTGLYPREADYTGLLAIDPNQPNVVFISSDVHPVTGLPNVSAADDERHYEIFKGVTRDGGASWTWTPITENSEADHLRPVIPIWEGSRRAVLWQYGTFRTYTDYNTDIVGIIEERS
jgi:Neuraminidase (sialidase)